MSRDGPWASSLAKFAGTQFPDLATTPGMTSTALLVALTTPHAGMPMFTLTSEQRDDIIAYILSLK